MTPLETLAVAFSALTDEEKSNLLWHVQNGTEMSQDAHYYVVDNKP